METENFPITCALLLEKSISFLTLQLKIKLQFEMKIVLALTTLTWNVLPSFCCSSTTCHLLLILGFRGRKTQFFSVPVHFSALLAPKALDYKCNLQSNLADEFEYILQC